MLEAYSRQYSSRKNGFRHLFILIIKDLKKKMFYLILRILHRSFEIENPKCHYSEVVVHLLQHNAVRI